MLQIFNKIFSGIHPVPKEWRDYIVVPIIKPGKPCNLSTSYRPIALASCVLKTYERIIKNSLEFWLANANLLPKTQYGFRKGTSTQEVIANLISDIQLGFTKNQCTSAIFLDIHGAYDNVVYNILAEKMKKLGVPFKIIKNIYDIYHVRRIFIKTDEGLSNAKEAKIGLPQGSILSPLLYIIYTYDLEHLFINSNLNILQFADDICIYTTKSSSEVCRQNLQDPFTQTMSWFNKNGLNLSPDKTVVCNFSRSRRQDPNTIEIGGITLPQKSTIKYLGVMLDKKLNWKDQILYVTKRTENGLNIIRAFSHKKWGADPSICLLFYKAFIRSILDYSSVFYGSAAQTHLKKLEIIKNKCLRQSVGFLKSTPISVMEAETGEPPLELRRNFISDKLLLKLISKNSVIIPKINQLTILCFTHSYWRVKKLPMLVQSYSWITQKKESIYSNNVLPYYQINYSAYDKLAKVIISNYEENNYLILKKLLLEQQHSVWKNYEHIFTDGSVLNGKTGCAFFHKNKKITKKIKLPDGVSIYSAELWAIIESLKYCINFDENNRFVIFSDCKSALTKLRNCENTASASYLISEIVNLCFQLKNNNKDISFVWIGAHIGIPENEFVDQEAKDASINGINADFKIPYTDVISQAKRIMLNAWQTQYSSSEKGLRYKNNFPNVCKKTWFRKESNKKFVMTISRIRCFHALYPKHMKKIGLRDDENCECGEMGDLDHYILECSRLRHYRETLFNNQKKLYPCHLT